MGATEQNETKKTKNHWTAIKKETTLYFHSHTHAGLSHTHIKHNSNLQSRAPQDGRGEEEREGEEGGRTTVEDRQRLITAE